MAERLSLVIAEGFGGERLDRALAALASAASAASALGGLSRSRIRQLIDSGAVEVDGKRAKASAKVQTGQKVVIELPTSQPLDLVAEPYPLDVLFEDEHVVAIAKPAGMTVHPGAGQRHGTLVQALLAHCDDLSGIGGVDRPGIVHRLDKDTSGVLIVAKHDRAHRDLARQFAAREVHKHYTAFVLGEPKQSAARIETLLARHPTVRTRFASHARKGRKAITRYRVEASVAGVSKLAVQIETGRTHQIRVHLSEHGHPILGDAAYGGRQWQRIKDERLRELAVSLGRHALHAAVLELLHPVLGVSLRLEAPLPAALADLWVRMRELGAVD